MIEMKDRISDIRAALRMDKGEMDIKLSLARGTWGRFENGIRPPTTRQITSIAKILNVSTDWLFVGRGEMFVEAAQDAVGRSNDAEIHTDMDYDFNSLVRRYAALLERIKNFENQTTPIDVDRALEVLVSAVPKEDRETARIGLSIILEEVGVELASDSTAQAPSELLPAGKKK